MKKILIVINRLGVGGAERVVVDDINEMLRRGVDVRLLTLHVEKEEDSLASDCLIHSEKWDTIYFKSFFDIYSWFLFARLVRKYKPDVVMSHLWYANTTSRIVSNLCRVKTHLIFEHNVYDSVKTKKMFIADRILQHFSTKIIAVSEAVRRSLIRNGINSKKIQVVHNGIDTYKYFHTSDKKLKEELNSKGEFTYLFIGRLIEQKGIDVLLEAFAKIGTGRLIIAGDGIDKKKLLQLRDSLGLQKQVHFLGIRRDIPSLLAISDCFVLPSRYEGLPIVLIEAIVAGKAIIISDFEAGKELITDGESGLIVPRENPEILSIAMRRIQEDENLRNRLKIQVGLDAKKFSIKHHVDALLHISNNINPV